MERKQGEVFKDGSDELEVIVSNGCDGCYYHDVKKCLNGSSFKIRGECSPMGRSDKTSVIFKPNKA